jgi:DNA primase
MASYDLSPQVVEQVRQAADIVAVVGEVVSLRKAGKNYVGLCPFHGERTPSFYVSPDKGTFYCFGCRKGGSVFDFVMETQHLSFPEAVETLAKRFGISLPVASRRSQERGQLEETLRRALEAAQAFFLARLHWDRPRAFLEARGLTLAQASEVGLGYAPAAWRELCEHLQKQGFSEKTLWAAGLVVQGEQGRLWDRFRDRITIPIRNVRGQLVGFGGRALGDAQPKYLNSPETPLFSKSTLLFGLDRAARAMGEVGEAILVEGYFDCLTLQLAGFTHTVATLGTALSEHHAAQLARRARRVLLCYDGDEAGKKAAKAALATLLAAGLEVAVVLLPEGQDPDLFLRQQGSEAFRRCLQEAASPAAFLLQQAGGGGPQRQQVREALDILARCPDQVLRFALLEELAKRSGIPLEYLQYPSPPSPGPIPTQELGVPAGELALLRAILLDTPEPQRASLWEQVPVDELQHPLVQQVAQVIGELVAAGRPLEISALSTHINDREGRRLLAALEYEAYPTNEEGLQKILRELWERQKRKKLAALRWEVERAQRLNDQQALNRALREMQELLASTGEAGEGGKRGL